ncbi:MAG TPA: abortive infection family protein [Spirochaetota bacterium]|nr:abortive infection family protein [Spirochaetota bacterium]
MADLLPMEKMAFEELFNMKSGYVIDFYNNTFKSFVFGYTGLDIFSEKYNRDSGSKANRLRSFWDQESNLIVAKLLDALLSYWSKKYPDITSDAQSLLNECIDIVVSLRQKTSIPLIDSNSLDNVDMKHLIEIINDAHSKDNPQSVLDRLHTLTVKYIRAKCDQHQLLYRKDDPLHGTFGAYVKKMVECKQLESKMSEYIMKSSIKMLEEFNHVRNNHSLAHDNPILNTNESRLIATTVIEVIKFIETIDPSKEIDKELSVS